jgi:hydrogenase nickel incorporation protein HypA/HybF
MHELAVCQALLTEVERVAGRTAAGPLARILVRVGPLSGVEPRLLERAFSVARAGTAAAGAELCVEDAPIRVRCLECQRESVATANRLLCGHCGHWRTDVVSGDELTLQRLEFQPAGSPAMSLLA